MRIAIKTLGCRLNQAESARMAADFHARGFVVCDPSEAADTYLVHTCTVTERADRACRRTARALRRRRPDALIALAGCAAEVVDEADILAATGADLLIRRADAAQPAERIADALGMIPAATAGDRPPLFRSTRALLKVQDGCDFMCSYCAVPLARGRARSRRFGDVVGEARRLRLDGHRELVVTGANLGCYSDGDKGLVDLLRGLSGLPGPGRIRLSSIECSTVEREAAGFMAESPRMCRFLHLPLQSGDDSVLRAMNRRYSAGDYRSFVQYATQLMPSLALGTDIITGFPGEDSRAFERTLELVRSLPFSNIHVFPFSARPGTQAAGMPGQVPWRIRRERASIITAEAKAKRAAYAEGFVGRTVEVLVERVAGDHARGWSGEYLETTVHHPGLKKGELVRVRVTSVEGASLRGNIPPTRCAGCLE